MRSLSFAVICAIGQAAAIPFGTASGFLEKRQIGMDNFQKHLTDQTLGWYSGEESYTQEATVFASAMGANRDSGGLIGDTVRNVLNEGYGSIPPPAGAIPSKISLKARTDVPKAETVKMRYGPYKVPNMNRKNLNGEFGMLSNWPDPNLARPCDGDCTILGMSAGLEYLNGSNANIDSGMWLHHMVLFNVGAGRLDATCGDRDISLPHATIGATPRNSERLFAAGNERSPAIFPDWGVKDAGYKLNPGDKFAALVELMNQTPEDQTVYLTMTYDFVQGHPFKDEIKLLWFDVRQCGSSEVNPPVNQSSFELNYSWTANLDAQVVGSIGHLHDGGAYTKLTVDGKETCQNNAQYGTKPEYIQKKVQGEHSHEVISHISDMNICSGETLAVSNLRKGQVWNLKAWYDFDKNKGMMHQKGDWEAVMGMTFTYVRIKGV